MKPIQLADLLELPAEERLTLVGDIWDSLAALPDAIELSETQRVELDRRLEAYHRNPESGAPWSEVKARISSSR